MSSNHANQYIILNIISWRKSLHFKEFIAKRSGPATFACFGFLKNYIMLMAKTHFHRWYRELCPRWNSEDWAPGPSKISSQVSYQTKPILVHLYRYYQHCCCWGWIKRFHWHRQQAACEKVENVYENWLHQRLLSYPNQFLSCQVTLAEMPATNSPKEIFTKINLHILFNYCLLCRCELLQNCSD